LNSTATDDAGHPLPVSDPTEQKMEIGLLAMAKEATTRLPNLLATDFYNEIFVRVVESIQGSQA
jgi:hypothetical protein